MTGELVQYVHFILRVFTDRCVAERVGFEPTVVSRTHAFQACSIDHSDISPFRINSLQSRVNGDLGNCDKSSNVRDHLRAFPV